MDGRINAQSPRRLSYVQLLLVEETDQLRRITSRGVCHDRHDERRDSTGERTARAVVHVAGVQRAALAFALPAAGPAQSTDPDARNPDVYISTLSGDLNGDDEPEFVNNDENSFHIVSAIAVDETAILDGFVIRGGNANGASWYSRGAGLAVFLADPTINGCLFEDNTALYGAAASFDGGSATLTSCRFSGNRVPEGGGAVCLHHREPELGLVAEALAHVFTFRRQGPRRARDGRAEIGSRRCRARPGSVLSWR